MMYTKCTSIVVKFDQQLIKKGAWKNVPVKIAYLFMNWILKFNNNNLFEHWNSEV